MDYRQELRAYQPRTPWEQEDKATALQLLELFPQALLFRENTVAHLTASSWIVDPMGQKVLLVYHSQYDSWSWTGGHSDGETQPLHTALREAQEETGLSRLQLGFPSAIALDLLAVQPHQKRGRAVGAHLHLNLTYLFLAGEDQPLRPCPGENRAVRWFPREKVLAACSEPAMKPVYQKLMHRTEELFRKGEIPPWLY